MRARFSAYLLCNKLHTAAGRYRPGYGGSYQAKPGGILKAWNINNGQGSAGSNWTMCMNIKDFSAPQC